MVSFSSLKSIAAKKSQQEFTIWGGRETNNDKKIRESPNQTQATTHKPHTLLTEKSHKENRELILWSCLCKQIVLSDEICPTKIKDSFHSYLRKAKPLKAKLPKIKLILCLSHETKDLPTTEAAMQTCAIVLYFTISA